MGTLENRTECSETSQGLGQEAEKKPTDFRGQSHGIRHPVAQCFYRTNAPAYTVLLKSLLRPVP